MLPNAYEMNEEAENIILGDREDIIILQNRKDFWKDKRLSDLVDDYFETNLLALDLCVAVLVCCERAGRLMTVLSAALEKFEQENYTVSEEVQVKKYSLTLEKMRNFRMFGNPFMEDLLEVCNSVYSHHLLLLKRLETEGGKRSKKLRMLKALRIVEPLWKKSLSNLLGQRQTIDLMQKGIYVVANSLDTIRMLADRFHKDTEDLLATVDLAIVSGGDAMWSAVEVTEKLFLLREINQDLSEHVYLCISVLRKVKNWTLDMIINYPAK